MRPRVDSSNPQKLLPTFLEEAQHLFLQNPRIGLQVTPKGKLKKLKTS